MGLVGLAAAGATRPAGAQAAGYTYFPSASTTDARFVALASSGLQTLSGNKVTIGFAAAESARQFEIGLFDGDTGGNWDMGATATTFTLYADPQGNGNDPADVPDPVVATWPGSGMPDGAWFDIPVTTGPEAQAPTGDYFYYMTVTLPANTPSSVNNAFKVRTTGTLMLEAQAISLISNYRTASDRLTVYPDWNTSTYTGRTTYDGKWDLFFDVPTDTSFFSVWDGDSDFGSFDGLGVDSDDPDTANVGDLDPATLINEQGVPVWAADTPAVPEMAAGAAPQDDNGLAPQVRRSPAVQYGIRTPDGEVFWNNNPSGNTEWEQFMISMAPFDRQTMDYHADYLPAGTYQVNIIGFDMGNLNAFRFLHDAMGVNASGDPMKPLRPYWTLGDRVWLDQNGNGRDEREPGIPGVRLGLFDAYGNPVVDGNGVPRTTRTDAGGFYHFNVNRTAIYTVKVDTTTLPAGLDNTSGGNQRTYEVVRSYPQQSFLEFDFGYAENGSSTANGQLGDRVWLDTDRDGAQDAGEVGIADVLVTLLDGNNNPVDMAATDAQGNYLFTELPGGIYCVEIDPSSLPAGLEQTYDLDGGDLYCTTAFLPEAKTRLDLDLGYAPLGSLGDTVWLDANLNGVQDSSELGIAGATLTLNGPGGTVATTTTDASGQYRFEQLAAGSYTVTVSALPANLTQTFDLDGINSAGTASASLTEGQTRVDVDFGYGYLGTLGDTVWLDANLNGAQDSGETGLSGVTATLKNDAGTTLATATTDANGKYQFTQLAPGSYAVTLSNLPANITQTFDLDGITTASTSAATLAAGEERVDVDFGYGYRGTLGDTVWLDANLNGVQDSNEAGISGVTATLKNAAGATLATTTTDANGKYQFTQLAAGNYTVVLSSLPANVTQTFDLDGLTTASNSTVTLSGGQNRLDVDFGYGFRGAIGDTVWLDANLNGVQDSSEAGISGVTVTLQNGSGATLATTTTSASGKYLFSQLAAGSYTVVVSNLPANLTQTFDLDGLTTVSKSTVTLAAGQTRVEVDFGYGYRGSLGDLVWKDTNSNGVQDSGETGISGVTVTLKTSAGATVATATTDANGRYLFSQLVAGSYTVTVSNLPTGLTQTFDLDGKTTANTTAVTLTAGQNRVDADFGYVAVAVVKFTTYTQGGWGSKPSGNNPGKLLETNFSKLSGCGLTIGGRSTLKFTSASAVDTFLPAGGTAGTLSCSATNPTTSKGGVLAGQVLALQINLAFSNAGITQKGLGALKLQSGAFSGYTASSFAALANKVLGGDSCLPRGATLSDVVDAATKINENFDNGTVNKGFLK